MGVFIIADRHRCLTEAVSESRCVLAVLSSVFFADECCVFCFENTVREAKVDVIYILYGDITSPDSDRLPTDLCDEVRLALRTSRRCFVSPVNERDLENLKNSNEETFHHKDVDQFWVRLCLAIPNRREDSAAEKERNPLLA